MADKCKWEVKGKDKKRLSYVVTKPILSGNAVRWGVCKVTHQVLEYDFLSRDRNKLAKEWAWWCRKLAGGTRIDASGVVRSLKRAKSQACTALHKLWDK